MTEENKGRPVGKKSVWEPILPIPEDAPAAKIKHGSRGDPLRIFVYHDAGNQLLGYTCRFLTSTGEALHLPLTWCRDQDGMRMWRWIQFPRMRPLYGLDRLAQMDDSDAVLLVFDEHSAEYARTLLPWLTTVSWPGGVTKIDEVDWSPLKGRMVFIWPTLERKHAQQRDAVADVAAHARPRDRQPMWKAALKLEKIVLGYGCTLVGIVDPWLDDERPEGFDLGMAGLQDWTPDQTRDWLLGHLRDGLGTEWQQKVRKLRGEPDSAAQPESASTPTAAGAGKEVKSVWIDDLVYKSGELSSCLHNVYQILANRPEWQGVVALDEFALKVVARKPPPFKDGALGEWKDTDSSRAAMWLQREYGFTPSSLMVQEAIGVLAEANRFNPVQDWLNGLVWDDVPRLEHWLPEWLGADDEDRKSTAEYFKCVGKWWLMGVVARAMRPGCKFDYVLVLEGLQGKRKSSAMAALGGEFFGDNDLDFSNKDSMLALQGKLIYEIAELGALARSDERKQKSFLSRRFDEFRPPYGRGFVKMPRQMGFCGTTNEWEWNKDPTGGRRFWPVGCGDIDLEKIVEHRDQLFAEALHYYLKGDRFWPTEEEQRTLFDPEQLRIEQPDAYVDALHDWVYGRTAAFSLAEAAMDCLKIDAAKLTRDIQTRIGVALRKLGCSRFEKKNGMTRFLYKPPVRSGQVYDGSASAAGKEGVNAPF